MQLTPRATERQHITSRTPDTLRSLDHWVTWRPGATKNGKFDKIPFDPTTGKPNNDKDPATWMSYSAARRVTVNVGYCLSATDGLTMIDCDRCVTNRIIAPRIMQIMQQCGGYWEYSPSGTGVKGWVRGKVAANVTGTLDGLSIEIYSYKRFGTVTGRTVPGFAGEPVDAQVALAALAMQLAPAPVVVDETPKAIGPIAPINGTTAAELYTHAQTLVTRLRRGQLDQATFQQISTELKHTNRAFVRAVAVDYNCAGTVDDELARHGCTHVSTSDSDKRYYTGLTTDHHSHKITLKVEDGPEGGTVWSLSPNSRLHQAGRHGLKRFDIVVQLDYHGDRTAAARAIHGTPATPTPPLQSVASNPVPQPDPQPTPTQIAAHKADALRKRAARKAEAAVTRDNVLDRAALDTQLSKGAVDTLLDLLDIAGDRDWCRPSNAQLAARRNVTERTIQRRMVELECSSYFTTPRYANSDGEVWSGGTGTAIRTFLRVTHENAMSPEYSNLDLSTERAVACKGGASSSPPPQPAAPLACHTVPDDTSEAYTLDYWAQRAAAAEARASQPKPRALPTEEARQRFCADMQREADKIEAQRLAAERAAHAAATDATAQATFFAAVEDAPVERVQFVPPREPQARQQYYKLLGAAKKARGKGNGKQAAKLERQANALREPVPAVQQARVVAAAPEAAPVAPPLQATAADLPGSSTRTSAVQPSPEALVHVCTLLASKRTVWERQAHNLSWWECAHDDDLPFDAMTFRAAALAAISSATTA